MDGNFDRGGGGNASAEGGMEFPMLDGAARGLVEAEVAGAFEEVDAEGFARGGDIDAQEDEALFAGEAGIFWIFGRRVLELVGPGLDSARG